MKTLYWHDYETWGITPAVDRPSQFAGVRTDEDLNIIEDPLVIYCQPTPEVLPHPQACLVTGITPQKAQQAGLPEADFFARIHRAFSQPKTCGVGYNSIRFDDEVTRYGLYRNFYDPYEREWKSGNSRWDIIDMVRLVYALRPTALNWPMEEGRPSFRLEKLTAENGIDHGSAHDAYSDVAATIALAKKIKDAEPKLYDYVYQHRLKRNVQALIDVEQRKPLLHISSMFSSEHGCAALIIPLCIHPVNKNAVVSFDLSADAELLLTLSAKEIAYRLFTDRETLDNEGLQRVPLKLIHLNKSPVLLTTKMLDDTTAARLKIDKSLCERHWQLLRSAKLDDKLKQVFTEQAFTADPDPETRLYDGFLQDQDRALLPEVRNARKRDLATRTFHFNDARYAQMIWRYQCRNDFIGLTDDQKQRWHDYIRQALTTASSRRLTLEQFEAEISQLLGSPCAASDVPLLHALQAYAVSLREEYGLVK